MIVLMGYLDLAPSDVDEFTADVQAVAASTRAEPGCLFYAFAWEEACAGRLLIAERWQDKESLIAHFERQHTLTFLKKWGSRIKGDILKYDASNERASTE